VIDSISFSDSMTSKNNIKNAGAPVAHQPHAQSKMLSGKDVDNKLDITSGDSNADDNEGLFRCDECWYFPLGPSFFSLL